MLKICGIDWAGAGCDTGVVSTSLSGLASRKKGFSFVDGFDGFEAEVKFDFGWLVMWNGFRLGFWADESMLWSKLSEDSFIIWDGLKLTYRLKVYSLD